MPHKTPLLPQNAVEACGRVEEMHMDPKTVKNLEGKLEEAIVEVILKMGLKKLPLLPSRHTFQMMAKAAAAVYEAAVENGRSDPR
jgi:hypothetical protein